MTNIPECAHRSQEDLDSDLLMCVLDDNKELLQKLLDAGANALRIDNIDRWIFSPLSYAIIDGDEEMVRMMLTTVSDTAQPCTSNGLPPLHLAAREGQCRIVELLCENNADINLYSEKGAKPLHLACERNHGNVVECLIRRGADIDCEDFDSRTPLHYASQRGFLRIAEILLRHGASVNTEDCYGWSALHWVCEKGYADVLEVLLENGADVNLHSKNFGTPLELALKFYKRKCVDLLERHIIKLKAASLYVLDSNLHAISGGANLAAFQNECEREIQRMKQSKIHKSISFYDILAQDPNHVALYMKNRVVLQAMMSGEHKTMFLIYAKMIENTFMKGQRRLQLLEASLESMNSLIGNRLPYMFVMDVLMYLNEEDHKNLIASTKKVENQ